MILIELTQVPNTVLPVADLAEHLRIGTGFDDDDLQTVAFEGYLRAAIAAIEARTGKALFRRTFQWGVTAWRESGAQVLPIAPVTSIAALKIVDANENETVVDANRYRLAQDAHRPTVLSTGATLPAIPIGGNMVIEFVAGYGDDWPQVPADLREAVMLLAAEFYENRSRTGETRAGLPGGVATLIEPYRQLRLFGGGPE